MSSDILDSVNSRFDHVAVTHAGRIIVWGKVRNSSSLYPLNEVLVHQDLCWRVQKTRGEHPHGGNSQRITRPGQVLDGKLYVYARGIGEVNYMDIYELDLTTWVWQKLEAGGEKKPLLNNKACCWPHGRSVYFFGDYADNAFYRNQLVALDTRTNMWVRPKCSGEIPEFNCEKAAAAANRDGKVFLLNGGHLSRSSLYSIDMTTFVWDKIEKPLGSINWPRDRTGHSLTAIMNDRLLVYGGRSCRSVYADCWVMNLNDMTWSRYFEQQRLEPRCDHKAVLDEQSGQVWILGGRGGKNNYPGAILQLTVLPSSLMLLALDVVVMERRRLHSPLEEVENELKQRLILEEQIGSYVRGSQLVKYLERQLESATKEMELFEAQLQEVPLEVQRLLM